MRVADYIFQYLADHGVQHVLLVSGGSAMHLNNALKKEKRIEYICCHHEQAAAIAAEGYARTSGKLAVVNVTSGPGGTNALTGVIGQWLDSVPVLYLSGQVKYETTIASVARNRLRQLGDQEINIVDIVRPVTKYAKMITDPQSIVTELEKAVQLATSGRPGPVWLDIPLNVQGALIDKKKWSVKKRNPAPLTIKHELVAKAMKMLQGAQRPLFIVGHGIRIAAAQKSLQALIRALNIPVVTTFNGFDLVASVDRHFIGRIGTLGSRAGNFALQNADLVICLGTRNNIRQVSYRWDSFARNAKKIIVDIDLAELHKKTVKGDLVIHGDVKIFMDQMLKRIPKGFVSDQRWRQWCLDRKKRYPVVLDAYKVPARRCVHPYHFIEELTKSLPRKAVVVAGNGTACVALFQAGVVKSGQRIFWNSGCASMGYDLPASIGAALASKKDVVCLAGDGSMQMNLQELQTIQHYHLPAKIFVLNNQGYRSIELTQTEFFQGDFIGCNEGSGVSFPDNAKLAHAYGLKYFKIDATSSMRRVIGQALAYPGAVLCEVFLTKDYIFAPKLSSVKKEDGRIVSRPLEDLYPFLDREELCSNMITPFSHE